MTVITILLTSGYKWPAPWWQLQPQLWSLFSRLSATRDQPSSDNCNYNCDQYSLDHWQQVTSTMATTATTTVITILSTIGNKWPAQWWQLLSKNLRPPPQQQWLPPQWASPPPQTKLSHPAMTTTGRDCDQHHSQNDYCYHHLLWDIKTARALTFFKVYK